MVEAAEPTVPGWRSLFSYVPPDYPPGPAAPYFCEACCDSFDLWRRGDGLAAPFAVGAVNLFLVVDIEPRGREWHVGLNNPAGRVLVASFPGDVEAEAFAAALRTFLGLGE